MNRIAAVIAVVIFAGVLVGGGVLASALGGESSPSDPAALQAPVTEPVSVSAQEAPARGGEAEDDEEDDREDDRGEHDDDGDDEHEDDEHEDDDWEEDDD